MALLPSGSAPKEVELVVIETTAFSLVIKGRPYHERYEGLQQYRTLDFHDVMQFDWSGNSVEKILVYDVEQQQLVPPSDLRPIFFENSVYQVIVHPKGDTELSFYHEHPSLRKAIGRVELGSSYLLMGNLQFQNEVGLSTFEVRTERKTLLQVTLEIFPSKLDYKRDYQKLLEEVNDEIYNLAYHFLKKTYVGAKVKLDGQPSLAEFYRLITVHFQAFLRAIERIERQPHHKLVKQHEKARGDQLQRLDSKARSYLRKNPHVFVEVKNGGELANRNMMPKEGLRIRKGLTYDTHENRYVKWMIGRLIEKLEFLYEKLTVQKWRKTEADEDLLEKVKDMIRKLTLKKKNPFWKEVGLLDRSVMSLVLQMAPGYRDAFQIYLTVSKGLALQGKLYQMSVKDVAELYEVWTFLKLGQLLRKKYHQVSQDVVKVNRDGLFVRLDTNQSAKRVFKHPVTDEKIVLTYQHTERNPTTTQKPDSVLSIAKKGKDYSYDYVFDAKYRIDFAVEDSYYGNRYKTPGPLEEDINTMHRYRDSIVAKQKGPYERTAFGAYVLFPWEDETGYSEHHFYKSIDEVNIGGLPFLPSATEMVEQFVEHLIEKSPEEIQEEGILPRGTKDDWVSSLDEYVLLGLVSSEDQYRSCMQEAAYVLNADALKRGWQEASYVALYVSKEAKMTRNGVWNYGKVKDVEVGEDGSVRFVVDSWLNLGSVIQPVHYGIAGYAMTTLTHLKEAKELPELFMKSKDELSVWRMLRRVSDWIKVDLDSEQLDEASSVQHFRFKDVEVRMNGVESKIEIVKGEFVRVVEYEELRRKPSGVFREVLRVIGE
ncbi:restriction endonuclease-like protein [Halalkalibacter okhensis]|uniref:5-methylcytosine-specific restriction related enzyme n=1 Tax=Halalkalibacter okhensis TaxID=333138 RepID=A0A0B0IPD1_9BACI|nr:restriction endonuclease-like protein [Halalkalibacter okhensis]KHF41541.1 5-methylcytosine-specific restriction related enzyme [Halalkalibacter okhensis]